MDNINIENVKAFLLDAHPGPFVEANELKDYLIDEAELRAEYVNDLEPRGLVNEYLKYNGIIGYTDDIINVIINAYNLEAL